MMHLNTDPLAAPAPTQKPCMRDMHELVKNHLPCAVVKLVPLAELERRAAEIVAEHPRYREEAPLVLALEHRRRAQHHALQRVGSRTKAPLTASQAYSHA